MVLLLLPAPAASPSSLHPCCICSRSPCRLPSLLVSLPAQPSPSLLSHWDEIFIEAPLPLFS